MKVENIMSVSPTLIQILFVQKIAGRSTKTGNDYDLRMAQCVVHKKNAEGQVTPMIGELVLPRKLQDTEPGFYQAEFELSIGNDKRIGSVVTALVPVKTGVAATPKATPADFAAK